MTIRRLLAGCLDLVTLETAVVHVTAVSPSGRIQVSLKVTVDVQRQLFDTNIYACTRSNARSVIIQDTMAAGARHFDFAASSTDLVAIVTRWPLFVVDNERAETHFTLQQLTPVLTNIAEKLKYVNGL